MSTKWISMVRMARTCVLALVACAGGLTAAWSPQDPIEPRLTDVFVAGEGAYHTYRIPSVIATPNGTLLAFAEGRRAGPAMPATSTSSSSAAWIWAHRGPSSR